MNDEHAAALLADKFGPSSNNDPQTQPLASKPKYGTMPPITTTASLPTTGMSNSNSFSTSMAPHGIQPHGLGAKLGIYSQAEDHPQAMTTHAPFDDDDDPQQQVQAYAKLEGPQLCYYMRTLSVILGRTTASNEDIDIDLGQSKGISRKHARIFYNFMHQGFELQVFGKNGCFVDDVYVEKGITVSLHHKSIVHIGEVEFTFLLPLAALEGPHNSMMGMYEPSELPMVGGQPQQQTHYADTITPQRLSIYKLPSPQKPYHTGISAGSPNMLATPSTAPLVGMSGRGGSPGRGGGMPYHTPIRGGVGGGGGGELGHNGGSYNIAPSKPGEVRILPSTEKPPAPGPRSNHAKPSYSYASLIAQAITSTEAKKITLNGIYQYIMDHYPYYKNAQNGWQNSIRHNLSLNKAFVKVQRATNEPGKGAYWTIDENHQDQFANGVYKRTRRTNKSKSGTKTSKNTNSNANSNSESQAEKRPANEEGNGQQSSKRAATTNMGQRPESVSGGDDTLNYSSSSAPSGDSIPSRSVSPSLGPLKPTRR